MEFDPLGKALTTSYDAVGRTTRVVDRLGREIDFNYDNGDRLTLTVAPLAVLANVIFGVAAAWAIARFRFPGRTLLVTLLDVPAICTSIPCAKPSVSQLPLCLVMVLAPKLAATLAESVGLLTPVPTVLRRRSPVISTIAVPRKLDDVNVPA